MRRAPTTAGQQFNPEDNMETPLTTSTKPGMNMLRALESLVFKFNDWSLQFFI